VCEQRAGIRRFVYASSSAVDGNHSELPKIEHRIGKALSPYSVTKFADELFARNFSDIYGIETIGLRYFNVFGQRQDMQGAYTAVIPRFVDALIKHENPCIYGDGTSSRDFTYIEIYSRLFSSQPVSLQPSLKKRKQPMKNEICELVSTDVTKRC
jgi:UDP-N-acetylglucosamine 4-epimerase